MITVAWLLVAAVAIVVLLPAWYDGSARRMTVSSFHYAFVIPSAKC